jgi:2-desacetyl-2-hydroxyethyl bacteriochlorophyllide A dehydrogenase
VCGTDLHLLGGMELPRHRSYPVRPGHEVAGTVIEGSGRGVGVGDRVVLHPLLPCGRCAACRAGTENRCRTATALGLDHAGGLADEVTWPLERMVPTPGVEPEQAAVLADAVASAYHALMLARAEPAGALTVLGPGGVGTQVLALARALDPAIRLTAIARSEATRERIEALGIGVTVMLGAAGAGRRVLQTAGPQDAVVDFGGGAEAIREALPMLARGGRLVIGSMGDEPVELGATVTQVATRELQVIGSYASTIADLRAVVELAASGRLNLSAAISHRVPLARAQEALETLEQRPPGLSRVVVVP